MCSPPKNEPRRTCISSLQLAEDQNAELHFVNSSLRIQALQCRLYMKHEERYIKIHIRRPLRSIDPSGTAPGITTGVQHFEAFSFSIPEGLKHAGNIWQWHYLVPEIASQWHISSLQGRRDSLTSLASQAQALQIHFRGGSKLPFATLRPAEPSSLSLQVNIQNPSFRGFEAAAWQFNTFSPAGAKPKPPSRPPKSILESRVF